MIRFVIFITGLFLLNWMDLSIAGPTSSAADVSFNIYHPHITIKRKRLYVWLIDKHKKIGHRSFVGRDATTQISHPPIGGQGKRSATGDWPFKDQRNGNGQVHPSTEWTSRKATGASADKVARRNKTRSIWCWRRRRRHTKWQWRQSCFHADQLRRIVLVRIHSAGILHGQRIEQHCQHSLLWLFSRIWKLGYI